MESCPYCGAELQVEATSCWKCGAQLSLDAEGDAPAADGDAIQQRKDEADEQIQCPFCETQNPAKALRCNRCGKAFRESEAPLDWAKLAWPAVGAVILAVLVGWVYWFATTRPPSVEPGRNTPLSVSFRMLERIYLSDGINTERLAEVWKHEHRHKFVQWEGKITSVADEGQGILLLEEGRVILALKEPEVIGEANLKAGKFVAFNARLADYTPGKEGKLSLDLGVLRNDN
ncbi:MAG: zinc ribbon domain-containing protein [Planctomycetota bacterium]